MLLILPLSAREKGKEKSIQDGVLDEIELTADSIPKYVTILVRRFPADKADIGTAKDADNERRTDAVKMLQSDGPRILAETLVTELGKSGTFAGVKESDEAPGENTLVVEGEFEMINPGSRAKRYWAGFGAGKSGIRVAGSVKDAQGQVLATFRHQRHSGFGIGGGDYVKFLTDDTRDVAKDLSQFLQRWATGGNLRKEAD
jgi:hypothetical protein